MCFRRALDKVEISSLNNPRNFGKIIVETLNHPPSVRLFPVRTMDPLLCPRETWRKNRECMLNYMPTSLFTRFILRDWVKSGGNEKHLGDGCLRFQVKGGKVYCCFFFFGIFLEDDSLNKYIFI